jgi:hypothetical protein
MSGMAMTRLELAERAGVDPAFVDRLVGLGAFGPTEDAGSL